MNLKLLLSQNCCEANLGYSLCDLRGQGSVHGVFREDEDAIPTMERTFECQWLCILIILRGNDIKKYFKIVKKV